MNDKEGQDDGLGCARGLMWAVPAGVLIWAAIIGLVMLVRGCHEAPTAQPRSVQAAEAHVT